MIELKDITKTFESHGESHQALRGVSLTIEDGDVFGIIGASGAGKSTLVRCINLLERPTSGQIVVNGVDVTNYQGSDLRKFREGVGMIFQNFSLFQQRNVLSNVMFPLAIRKVPRKEAQRRALDLLEMVGLPDKANRYPSELSGGQQQRVAIARALVNEPGIMLCDEATSALDSRTTIQILDLLRDINKRLGVTLIIITHSLQVAHQVCNRIAVIDDGQIVEEGLTQEIFDHPSSAITRDLLRHAKTAGSDANLDDEATTENERNDAENATRIGKDPSGGTRGQAKAEAQHGGDPNENVQSKAESEAA